MDEDQTAVGAAEWPWFGTWNIAQVSQTAVGECCTITFECRYGEFERNCYAYYEGADPVCPFQCEHHKGAEPNPYLDQLFQEAEDRERARFREELARESARQSARQPRMGFV